MATLLFEDQDYRVMTKRGGEHFDDPSITHSGSAGVSWEPVHRLDFETSGLLLCARPALVEVTRKLFQDPSSSLKKIYLAGASQEVPNTFVHGKPVYGFIGSRYRSSKKVRWGFEEKEFRAWHSVRPASLIVKEHEAPVAAFQGKPYEVQLLTGARHQIRAFFASAGAPLCGDVLYGAKPLESGRLELHSWKMSFEHPEVEGKILEFEAPLA